MLVLTIYSESKESESHGKQGRVFDVTAIIAESNIAHTGKFTNIKGSEPIFATRRTPSLNFSVSASSLHPPFYVRKHYAYRS